MTDYFGFNDSRGNVSGLNNKNTSQKHGLYSTFRCDKPYRLALYWQPSIKRRRLDASAASKSTIEKSNESLTITHNISLDKSVNHETEVAKPTRKKNNTKINNKENEGRNKKTRTASKKKDATLFEIENTPAVEIRQSGRLRELNGKKSSNVQKSNEKSIESALHFKDHQSEFFDTDKKHVTFSKKGKIEEPTTATTDETIEVKRRPSITYSRNKSKPKEPVRTKQKETARTKQKDTTRTKNKMPKAEEEEFEKWAASLNKEFDEVENFDLSVNYD